MTERQCRLASLELAEIKAGLEAITEGRVVDGDPAAVETDLLQRLDEIVSAVMADYSRHGGG